MKVSEDRFPLLLVYLEEQEQQSARARTVTRGAAEIVGRWPQYLTHASYVSAIGLFSLLVCFALSALVLSLIASEHNPRRFSPVKFGGNLPEKVRSRPDPISAFYLTPFATSPENGSYVVDVLSDRGESGAIACSLESYLLRTSLPVYHVRLVRSEPPGNETVFGRLEEKFKNYRMITLKVDSFLRGTRFADVRDRERLTFIGKVLIAWNFGGVVLDSSLIAVSDFHPFVNDRSLLVGLSGGEMVLLASRDPCHSFVFALMKHLAVNSAGSQEEAVRKVYAEFCGNGRNCTAVDIVSDPFFCKTERDDCVFVDSRKNPAARSVFGKVCPATNP